MEGTRHGQSGGRIQPGLGRIAEGGRWAFPPRGSFAVLAALILFVAVASIGGQSCEQRLHGEVGADVCLACHDGRSAPDESDFPNSRHATIGCEGCHGPGYLHVRNGGRGGLFISNPGSLPFEARAAFCGKCHPKEEDGFVHSVHNQKQILSCTTCHNPHSSLVTRRNAKNNDLCLDCHVGRGFDSDAAITAHTYHPVDPAGTGASRCALCHLPPLERQAGSTSYVPHDHSLRTIPPIASNEAAEAGISPTPNSCSGIIGCHDGSVITAPVFNVDKPEDNRILQEVYDLRYGTS
jgi:predicted CXXCH cytochrome family protein